MSGEITREEVLEGWFFEAPVYQDGRIQAVPNEAIEKRDELKETWLPTAEAGCNEVPIVKLTPVFRSYPTGWKVEKAVRYKKNTTMDLQSVRNN